MGPSDRNCAALNILLLWLGFMAGWTIGSVPLTLAGASFGLLWIAGVCGIVGALMAMRGRHFLAELLLATPDLSADIRRPPRPQIAVACFAVAGIVGATVYFIPTGDARGLWGVSILVALISLTLSRHDHVSKAPEWTPQQAPTALGVAVLALGIWLAYVFILRPDADDAFYLNLPMGLAKAPHGMLLWDTMYGAPDWPVLGSNYRVEALQTLIAAIAWTTGLSVVHVAHLVLPTIWCLAWAATLAVIGTAVFGRKWWVFATLAVLSTFVFAGTLQSWGTHGVSRLFHGKAPLILIVIPLIYVLVYRSDATGTPLRKIIPVLAALICVALGLTANAIYIAPLALGIAVFAGWVSRGFGQSSRLWVLAAAIPALAAGLWLLIFDTPVTVPENATRSFVDLALWNMFPDKILLALMALTLCVAALAAFIVPGARFIGACLLGTLVFVLNPYLWPVYDNSVTGGLNFRLWWAIPVPFLFAVFLAWAVLRVRHFVWPLSAAIVILSVLSMTSSGLFGMSETEIKSSFTKRPAGVHDVVTRVVALSDRQKVLAAEGIAAWLPTVADHPPLVYVRQIYLDQSMTVVDHQELDPRRILAAWINGEDQDQEAVSAALIQQCVAFLVFAQDQKPTGFDALPAVHNVVLVETIRNQMIFSIDSHCR